MATPLLLLFLAADPVPPVVGRPLDFSGAVGGPFVVTLAADPTTVTPEEPLTLTLTVTGPGNLTAVRRPALDAFQKDFAVEPLDEATEPVRTFRYRLRPRSAEVTEVPPVKFVYFNPKLPASRGWQTTYSEPVPLTVTAKPPAVRAPQWVIDECRADSAEIEAAENDRLRRPAIWDEIFWSLHVFFSPPAAGERVWPVAIVAVAVPPLACVVWLAFWKRRNPDAARAARLRESRAAAVARRALAARSVDVPQRVADALLGYLRDRAALPPEATTSAEAEAALRIAGCAPERAADVGDLLRRCERARFAPAADDAPLATDADRLIRDWEATA
ncbi:MAG: BatD family protein [Gemmataceae bacterium]